FLPWKAPAVVVSYAIILHGHAHLKSANCPYFSGASVLLQTPPKSFQKMRSICSSLFVFFMVLSY
ncbi:MAG: hypothetical protein IJ720_02645, partial [Clostridia bacterium]|nr:hypothetical protein [Clostridia bacterium]